MRRIADEIDLAECSVVFHFSHHPAYTAFLEWVVAMSIESYDEQFAIGCSVESHALVHDIAIVAFRESHSFGRFVFGKGYLRFSPVTSVGRSHVQRVAWRLLFILGVGEIFQIETAVPVGEVGSMVVGPSETVLPLGMRPVGPHHLDVFRSDGIAETAIVKAGIAYFSSGVGHRFCSCACLCLSGTGSHQ